METTKQLILNAFMRGDYDKNARTVSELRNKNIKFAFVSKKQFTKYVYELITADAIVVNDNGFEVNKKLIDNRRVEILHNDFDVDRLANYARLTTGNDASNDQYKNKALCRTLFRAQHLTPFEFFGVTVKFTVPIYIARQLMRYRAGVYLEKSLRRTEPVKMRGNSERAKYNNTCVNIYRQLLKNGIKKEDARAVLPLMTETCFVARWNYRELAHIFDERLKPDTQADTRAVVAQLYEQLKLLEPDFIEAYELSKKGNK